MRIARPRISIAALMWIILILCVGMAALRYPNKLWESLSPNKLWASFLISMTSGILTIAALGAWFHRGSPRAFWAGFASSGWLFLLANFGPWFESEVSPYIFTTAVLDLVYPYVAPPERTAVVIENKPVIGQAGGFGGRVAFDSDEAWAHWTFMSNSNTQDGMAAMNNFSFPRSKPFRMIGHSLFALIFAHLGGVIARRFARLGASTVHADPEAPR